VDLRSSWVGIIAAMVALEGFGLADALLDRGDLALSAVSGGWLERAFDARVGTGPCAEV
jgi:hypothetical protein